MRFVLVLLAALIFASTASAHKLTVGATAYCLKGRTATGTYVFPGTVAVDPRVIPLYTRMYIPGYGFGVALDTGGAIKGRRIDVWFSSCSRAITWGYRTKTITLLKKR